MRFRKKLLCSLLTAAMCCTSVLGGCASQEKSSSPENGAGAEEEQAAPTEAAKMYKPSELSIPRQDKYEYPYMGMNFSLPESLMERMDKKEAAMLNFEGASDDGVTLGYGLISWKSMTEEQRDMEIEADVNGFYDWADSLGAIGAIGVYDAESAKTLDTLTGCTEHQEIGRSGDGAYTYYLSVNPEASDELKNEINSISYELTDMEPIEENAADSSGANGENLGEFSMKDINGKEYTQEMFADYDLTMVNVFTTWCTPCIKEIPDLEKLHQEMKGQGMNVVGIVLDSLNDSGKTDKEAVEKAKLLEEKTGASYPFLIPDEGRLNGRLSGINAVPETFFVDRDGNIVGETYSGSHSFEDWKSIIEKELEGVGR